MSSENSNLSSITVCFPVGRVAIVGGWVRSQRIWGGFWLTWLGINHCSAWVAFACAGNCGGYGADVHAGGKTDWGVVGEEFEGTRYGE